MGAKSAYLSLTDQPQKFFDNRIGRCKNKGFDPFLTVNEAADYLGVSRRFLYERLATKEIESQPMGRLRRIRLSTLEKWLIHEKG